MPNENIKSCKRNYIPSILSWISVGVTIIYCYFAFAEYYPEKYYISYVITSICLIVFGNTLVVALLLTNFTKKSLSKKYSTYVFTFYGNIFSKNLIEVIIGLVGQVILILLYIKDHIKYEPYFIIYSLVFYAFCAAPILKALFSRLESVYSEAVGEKLVRCLYSLRSHYIVVGYGRFGKTVVGDLFETYAHSGNIHNKHTRKQLRKTDNEDGPAILLKNVLNKSLEEVLLCINMVVVDKDESLFSNVFEHPHFGRIGFVVLDELKCLGYDRKNYKKRIYIPAIVGNAKNSSILDLARIKDSEMILSLSPKKAVTKIFHAIIQKQKGRKGLLVIPSTYLEHHLIPESYDTNISFVHRYRINGWELGDIIAAHIIRNIDEQQQTKKDARKQIKILILGSGKQLHFVLEKIWLEVICEGQDGSLDKNFIRNNILIIGDDEYINMTTVIKDSCTYWKYEIAYVTNKNVSDENHSKGNYRMLIPYLKGIPHDPATLGPIFSGKLRNDYKEMKKGNATQTSLEEPFNKINPEFFSEIPEIVIVTSESNVKILKTFNELSSISRKRDFNKKLRIIVESSPVIHKTIMKLNSESTKNLKLNSDTRYPTPLIDKPYPVVFTENVVNSTKDGNKMVRGYIEAMTRPNGVIIRSCLEDMPGAFAKLALLYANLKINNDNIDTEPASNDMIPSFHNTQALPQKNGYFCFFSDADLVVTGNQIKIERNHDHIREVFVSSNNQTNKEDLVHQKNTNTKNKEAEKISRLIPTEGQKNISGCCVGLTYCPVSTFHQSISAESNPLTEIDKEKARWCNMKDPERKSNKMVENKRYENFAKIYSCCQGGDGPGAIAVLLYRFMLNNGKVEYEPYLKIKMPEKFIPEKCFNDFIKDNTNINYDKKKRELSIIDTIKEKEKKFLIKIVPDQAFKNIINDYFENNGTKILDLKYVMNFECYNPGFELLKMYGNIVKPPKNMRDRLEVLEKECLQGIVISPVKSSAKWMDYASKLKKKSDDCRMYYDGDRQTPNNILVITENYKDILLKEYIQLEVSKFVYDAYIQGKIKDESFSENLKFELSDIFSDLANNSSMQMIEQENIKKFVDNILSSAIDQYIEERNDFGKKKVEKALRDSIGRFFHGADTSGSKTEYCQCPIADCQFKSKALYLLTHGTKIQDEK